MAKINITKPTGSEVLNLISAFKADNNIYVIFDSERMGSMGLPIIYISKYQEKLQKVNDENEWQSVKNYLKGIISGTNFEYTKINENVNADEVYYTPLTLPQASFDIIKNRYVVADDNANASVPTLEPVTPVNAVPTPNVVNNEVVSPTPVVSDIPVVPLETPTPVAPVAPSAPVMPNNDVSSNASVYTSVPNTPAPETTPSVAPQVVEPTPVVTPAPAPITPEPVIETSVAVEPPKPISNNLDTSIFMQDKETFLKACENMFDALVSKYQKHLNDLETREQELLKKEQEIDSKLKDASEHLANAQAKEQVANIAHDNAQKIMDISGLMPNNPNGTQTGVI